MVKLRRTIDVPRSGAGLALRVHLDRVPGVGNRLNAMLLAAEVVRHVVVRGLGMALHVIASLHVGRIRRATAVAADVGPDRAARNRSADRGAVVATAVSDLVAEDAAHDRADEGARDVHAVLLRGRLMLDPAALLGSSH